MLKDSYVIWQVKKEKLLYTNAGFKPRDYQNYQKKENLKCVAEVVKK